MRIRRIIACNFEVCVLFSDIYILTERAQRKPRAEPESKQETEPENVPESKNNAFTEPNSEPEGNSIGNSEPTPENWLEPGPRWNDAYKTWKWAWELHVYLYATVFLAIGLFAGYYVIANVYDGLQEKYLSVSLNIMVAFFGFTRAFDMYLDPYHQGNIIHNTAVMRVIWSLSGPCLTASDCLMILALIETAKISIAPPKLQKASVNAAIIIFHFTLVVTTDCIVTDYVQAKVMLLFCQLFFVTWGSVLGTANFVLGYKPDKQLFSHKTPKETADRIYIYLIYASGAANYFLCAIIIYSAFGVFGVYSDVQFVDAWPWWALQTLSRFSELLACVLIFTVSAKRTWVKDAVSMVTGDKVCECVSSTEVRSSSELNKGRLTNCFNRKKKVSKNENGSSLSLFTALREIALAQATGDDWHGTNPVPRITTTGECWIETKTTCSIIHVPGESQGEKCDSMLNSNGEDLKSRELVGFSYTRRESCMFTAVHEVKKINLNKVSPENNCSSFNAGVPDGADETKNHATTGNNSDKDLSECAIITLPNETILKANRHGIE